MAIRKKIWIYPDANPAVAIQFNSNGTQIEVKRGINPNMLELYENNILSLNSVLVENIFKNKFNFVLDIIHAMQNHPQAVL